MSAMVDAQPNGDDADTQPDGGIVDDICALFTATEPKSFFLFAGAGSGKTRTLVEVLRRLTGLVPEHEAGGAFAARLREGARTIGVITYTNNAVAVIKGRLGVNPLVSVATIHTFAWQLVQGFDDDIREALIVNLQEKIAEEEAQNALRTRPPTRTSRAKLEKWRLEIGEFDQVTKFTYTPDKLTYGPGALQHAHVLQVASRLLRSRPTLARILNDRHPALLIDESQDTTRDMLDALIEIEQKEGSTIRLGLIGDHRQRIYADGHQDLPSIIPADWERPALRMNHRSQARIVRLINRIWASQLDGRTQAPLGGEQVARSTNTGGLVRLFVGSTSEQDKPGKERWCAERMADITNAEGWRDHRGGYKALMLEHKLAARRGGFRELAEALEFVDRDQVYSRDLEPDGSRSASKGISELKVFRGALVELRRSMAADDTIDEYEVINVLGRRSPLMQPIALAAMDANTQRDHLAKLRAFVESVVTLWRTGGDPTLGELVRRLVANRLFPVHERLENWAQLDAEGATGSLDSDSERRMYGLNLAMQRPWSELMAYIDYLEERTSQTTHQAVKGSEYEHVLVVLDDDEAGGFLFSYDKLFGAADLSDRDRSNVDDGRETTIDRTLRLFYVTCSRPKESLAVVYWSSDPDRALTRVHSGDWFDAAEVVRIPTGG